MRRRFTPKQKKIAALLMQGYTSAEMCKELNMKPRTLKSHLTRMYDRFWITDRYVKRVRLIYLLWKEQGGPNDPMVDGASQAD